MEQQKSFAKRLMRNCKQNGLKRERAISFVARIIKSRCKSVEIAKEIADWAWGVA
jgi:hypothetical protein